MWLLSVSWLSHDFPPGPFSVLTIFSCSRALLQKFTCYTSAWMTVHKFRQIIDLEQRVGHKDSPFQLHLQDSKTESKNQNTKSQETKHKLTQKEHPASRIRVTKWILMHEQLVLKAKDQEKYTSQKWPSNREATLPCHSKPPSSLQGCSVDWPILRAEASPPALLVSQQYRD